MSFDLLRRIRDLDLTSPPKAVLICLALRVGETGEAACWPSHTLLARDSGFGVSTVRRALKDLATAGYIRIEGRSTSDGDRDSNRYVLTVESGGSERADVGPLRTDVPPERAEVYPERADPSVQSEQTGMSRASREDPEGRSRRKIHVDRRGTRLPADWAPDQALLAFAHDHGVANVDALVAQFKDHWAAAAGRNATKLDWSAAFRTWVRNDEKFRSERRGRSLFKQPHGTPPGGGSKWSKPIGPDGLGGPSGGDEPVW